MKRDPLEVLYANQRPNTPEEQAFARLFAENQAVAMEQTRAGVRLTDLLDEDRDRTQAAEAVAAAAAAYLKAADRRGAAQVHGARAEYCQAVGEAAAALVALRAAVARWEGSKDA